MKTQMLHCRVETQGDVIASHVLAKQDQCFESTPARFSPLAWSQLKVPQAAFSHPNFSQCVRRLNKSQASVCWPVHTRLSLWLNGWMGYWPLPHARSVAFLACCEDLVQRRVSVAGREGPALTEIDLYWTYRPSNMTSTRHTEGFFYSDNVSACIWNAKRSKLR